MGSLLKYSRCNDYLDVIEAERIRRGCRWSLVDSLWHLLNRKGWYAPSLMGRRASGPSPFLAQTMSFRVISFTMAQVRQGALGFQRSLSNLVLERPEIQVYSVSPFDLDERRRVKDRFGGDIVYFFNDAAFEECERLRLDLQFLAEVSDDELPRRRSLVVGLPESKRGISTN
jgi:hypothetical protein